MLQRTHVCDVQIDSVSDASRLLDLGGLAVDRVASDAFGGRTRVPPAAAPPDRPGHGDRGHLRLHRGQRPAGPPNQEGATDQHRVISAKPYIESFLRARDSSFVSDSFEGLDRPAAVWASDDPSRYLGRTYGSPDGRRPWPSCRVCVLRGRSWLCCPGCAVRVHVRDDGSRWTPESVTAAQASGQAPLTWHVSGSPTSSTVRNLHLHSRSERYRPFPNRGRRASRVADVDTIAHPTNPSTCPGTCERIRAGRSRYGTTKTMFGPVRNGFRACRRPFRYRNGGRSKKLPDRPVCGRLARECVLWSPAGRA